MDVCVEATVPSGSQLTLPVTLLSGISSPHPIPDWLEAPAVLTLTGFSPFFPSVTSSFSLFFSCIHTTLVLKACERVSRVLASLRGGVTAVRTTGELQFSHQLDFFYVVRHVSTTHSSKSLSFSWSPVAMTTRRGLGKEEGIHSNNSHDSMLVQQVIKYMF